MATEPRSELAPTFANTGVLTHHGPGCRCWPHVSKQDALDAIAAVGLAEYRDGKARADGEAAPVGLRADLYDAIESVLASDHGCPCDMEHLRALWLRDRAAIAPASSTSAAPEALRAALERLVAVVDAASMVRNDPIPPDAMPGGALANAKRLLAYALAIVAFRGTDLAFVMWGAGIGWASLTPLLVRAIGRRLRG